MPLSIKTGAVKVKDSEGDYVDIDLTLSDGYAPLESPAFTGTPTAPTPGVSDDSTKIATTAFVQDVADNLNGAISDAATTNLLDTFTKTNETVNGVTITWLGDGSVKANGTCSSTNWNTVYQSTTQMPSGIVAGQTYKASMKTTNEKLYMIILAYTGSWTSVLNTSSSTPVSFTVPSNATGFWIRVNIQGSYTFSNDIAKPVIYAANALSGAIASVENGIAIVANGNTHAAIAKGQYVYIKGHGTLAEGLYKATAAIALNGELSTTNVTAASGGGFNDLLNSAITGAGYTPTFKFGTSATPTVDNINFAYRVIFDKVLYIYGRFRLVAKNTTDNNMLGLSFPSGYKAAFDNPGSMGTVAGSSGMTDFVVRATNGDTGFYIAYNASGSYSSTHFTEGSYYTINALFPVSKI
mgnify:CR=1 FL=1